MIIKIFNTLASVFYRNKRVNVLLSASPFVPPADVPQSWTDAVNYTWDSMQTHTWSETRT